MAKLVWNYGHCPKCKKSVNWDTNKCPDCKVWTHQFYVKAS